MRRFFSIGVALLMVLSTIGVTINKHYSRGELYDIALFDEADPCCEMDCGCCYKESETYRITDEFIPNSFHLIKVFSTQTTASADNKVFGNIYGEQKTKFYLRENKSPPEKYTSREYSQTFLL